MSTDYTTQRILSDIQSKLGSLDHRLLRMTAGAPDTPRAGAAFFALAMSALHRHRQEHDLADRMVQRAAVNPAMTTVDHRA